MDIEAQQAVVEVGREAWYDLDEEVREDLVQAQNQGMIISREVRSHRALIKCATPGTPKITPNISVWNYEGLVDNVASKFNCAKRINFLSFVNVPDFNVLQWLVWHKLMDNDCNRQHYFGMCEHVSSV